MDIELRNGDLFISQSGDIILTDSIKQKIQVKILWILGEWKWNKEEGIDYFEDVVDVIDIEIKVDAKNRRGSIFYTVSTDEETIRGEVEINGKLWSNR